jgi:hypothetical protein
LSTMLLRSSNVISFFIFTKITSEVIWHYDSVTKLVHVMFVYGVEVIAC